jgi:hypothetical protein
MYTLITGRERRGGEILARIQGEWERRAGLSVMNEQKE